MESNRAVSLTYSTQQPSPARMYDYFLGGHHNFEVDRRAATAVANIYPDVFLAAQANRALLRRMVTFLSEQGIDQFLDLGSGIPSVGNVHQVARTINPAARIVYVDIDPIAVAHSETLLRSEPYATVIHADIRQINSLLRHREIHRLLDFSRPVAVLTLALFHFIPDDAEALFISRSIRNFLPSGSYLALSHATDDGVPLWVREQVEHLYGSFSSSLCLRTRHQIRALFDGLSPVDPGVVYAPLWRPEAVDDRFIDQPERSTLLAGIGYKS